MWHRSARDIRIASHDEPGVAPQAINDAEEQVEGYMAGILNKERPDKDSEVVILTKYLVSPDIALDFIKAIKLVKEDVKARSQPKLCLLVNVCISGSKNGFFVVLQDSEGNQIYSLVKTKVRGCLVSHSCIVNRAGKTAEFECGMPAGRQHLLLYLHRVEGG